VPEIGSQQLGEGEEELPVGQCQQEPLVHVLRELEGPFLRAGRAEIERLTGERPEVFILAVRIRALDARDALGVVAAENELLHHLGDPLDAETPVDDRVLGFVLIGQALEMPLEQKQEGGNPTRLVHSLGDRGELKG
jgi:hypothetical protein